MNLFVIFIATSLLVMTSVVTIGDEAAAHPSLLLVAIFGLKVLAVKLTRRLS